MFLERNKSNTGITLIALVVSIIVLLILAGISISMLSGDNGLLTKAVESKERTEKASIIENAQTDILAQITGNKGNNITEDQLKDILKKQFKDIDAIELTEDLSSSTQILTTLDNKYNIKLTDIYDGKIMLLGPGLYDAETNEQIYSWDELIENDILNVVGTSLYSCKDKTKIDGNLILDNSITAVTNSAFQDCKDLKNIKLGNQVQIISNAAFSRCTGLTEIVIPDSVIEISNTAFGECSNLKKVTLGNRLKKISYSAFYKCSQISSIQIPHLEELIGAPFAETSITTLVLPEGLTTLGSNALCGFSGDVYLPKTLTEIGSGVYIENNGQYNLTFYYAGTETEWNNINISSGNEDLVNSTIHYETTAN